MRLGRRRMSPDIEERYAADKELAATYPEALRAARAAEEALRHRQAVGGDVAKLAAEFDRDLLAAMRAAEAAERVEMGPKTYPRGEGTERRTAQLEAFRSKARASVRPWTDEVDRLRTLREDHKLTYRPDPASVR